MLIRANISGGDEIQISSDYKALCVRYDFAGGQAGTMYIPCFSGNYRADSGFYYTPSINAGFACQWKGLNSPKTIAFYKPYYGGVEVTPNNIALYGHK